MEISDHKMPSNKNFGYFFAFVFIAFGAFLYFKDFFLLSFFLFFSAGIFFLLSAIRPEWLSPLNQTWLKIGLIMGTFISPIVLGVIFFGIFTPISVLMKIFQRDELSLKFSDQPSFWKARRTHKLIVDSFKNQFWKGF